jgi:hypothetical protein
MRLAADECLQAIERLDASLDDESESGDGELVVPAGVEDESRLES